MSVKGGYHILNLQNKDLQYSPTIPGAYESVEGSYQKPILLSGIVIGGVEKADVYRMPVVSGSSYVFENVYGYDLTLTDSDGLSLASTQWATRAYASLLTNEVDADGHKRFQIFNGTPHNISGVTFSYYKASLSGYHLAVVMAGSIDNGTTTPHYGDVLMSFELPEWIMDKIIPVYGNIFLETKTINLAADDTTTQSYDVLLVKQNGKVNIDAGGAITLTADRNFRVQFDLIID